MIELVRNWLLGVTGVAILAAMADNLMPKGTVKGVGRLTGGLVLLVAMLTPILSLDLETILPVSNWESEITLSEEELEQGRKKEMESLIAEEMGAYIVDKAGERGIFCSATITCEEREGIFLPQSVTLYGVTEVEEQAVLSRLVGEELGISQSKIQFTEWGEEG